MPLSFFLGKVGIMSLFDCSTENILTAGIKSLSSELLQALEQFVSILAFQVSDFSNPKILKVSQGRWSD